MKAAPIPPLTIPRNTNQGNWVRLVNSNGGTVYQGRIPKKLRDTIVATTDAKTSGANRFIEKLPSTISAANTAPEMGALYAAAIPDAAPHPTNSRNRYGGHLATWPHLDDSVAASCTMPPSRPIDPPDPIVTSDDRNFTMPLRSGKRPSPATTTSSRLLERRGPAIRSPQCNTRPAHKPPKVGVITRCQGTIFSATSTNSPGCRRKNRLTDSVA